MSTVSICIADDHSMVRLGLKSLLESNAAIQVVGEAEALDVLPGRIRDLRPDLLLLDVKFQAGESFATCQALKEEFPDLKVLFLTSHGSDQVLFQCIQAGADGFLLKDVDGDELMRGILDVAGGRSILDPSVTGRVFSQIKSRQGESLDSTASSAPIADPPKLVEPLSQQEMRVLKEVAAGLTNKEIAEELRLSPKTVKNYLSNAMGKLGFHRRAQAAAYYVKYYSESN